MTKQKGKWQELEQLKPFSKKIQEFTLNIAITEKNEKQYVRLQLSILGTQEAFSNKVDPDIDGFTDGPVVQWDVDIVKIILKMNPNKQ